MDKENRVQELLIKNGALTWALDKCLAELAEADGREAHRKIKVLRDELIRTFKQSDIAAERELEHAKIVGPAIAILETVFNDALRNPPNNDIDRGRID
jgi:hypothetical protein